MGILLNFIIEPVVGNSQCYVRGDQPSIILQTVTLLGVREEQVVPVLNTKLLDLSRVQSLDY